MWNSDFDENIGSYSQKYKLLSHVQLTKENKLNSILSIPLCFFEMLKIKAIAQQ